MDSLDRMDLSLNVERRFGFSGDQVPASVAQLYALAGGFLPREPPKPPPAAVVQAGVGRPDPDDSRARPLPRRSSTRALAHRRDVATADDLPACSPTSSCWSAP